MSDETIKAIHRWYNAEMDKLDESLSRGDITQEQYTKLRDGVFNRSGDADSQRQRAMKIREGHEADYIIVLEDRIALLEKAMDAVLSALPPYRGYKVLELHPLLLELATEGPR